MPPPPPPPPPLLLASDASTGEGDGLAAGVAAFGAGRLKTPLTTTLAALDATKDSSGSCGVTGEAGEAAVVVAAAAAAAEGAGDCDVVAAGDAVVGDDVAFAMAVGEADILLTRIEISRGEGIWEYGFGWLCVK